MEEVIIPNTRQGVTSAALTEFLGKLNSCPNLGRMKSFLSANRDLSYHWYAIDGEQQEHGLLIVSAKKSAEPTELHKSLCGTIFNFDFYQDTPFSIAIVPPQMAFDRTDFGKVLRSKGARLYRLHSGSAVNLHHNESIGWVVSTANGCYMNKVSWSGLTFMELTVACLKSRDLTIDDLDKNATYSLVCKHPEMHPMTEEASFVVIASTDPNLPADDVEVPITDFQSISFECEQALDNAVQGLPANYGYIVRNDNTVAAMQSSLMKFIFEYHNSVPQAMLKDPRRQKWLDLRGYMSFQRDSYQKIFKKQQQFDEFDAKFTALAQKITLHHHLTVKPTTDPIVSKLYDDARKLITIDSPVGSKLLRDLIINPNNLPFYLAQGFLD